VSGRLTQLLKDKKIKMESEEIKNEDASAEEVLEPLAEELPAAEAFPAETA